MSTTGARPLKLVTVDEVVPQSKGGRRWRDNQVLACKACNQTKADRMPTDDELRRLAALIDLLPPVPIDGRVRDAIDALDEMDS